MSKKSFNWNFKTAHVAGESHVRASSREAYCNKYNVPNIDDVRVSRAPASEVTFREKVAS